MRLRSLLKATCRKQRLRGARLAEKLRSCGERAWLCYEGSVKQAQGPGRCGAACATLAGRMKRPGWVSSSAQALRAGHPPHPLPSHSLMPGHMAAAEAHLCQLVLLAPQLPRAAAQQPRQLQQRNLGAVADAPLLACQDTKKQ